MDLKAYSELASQLKAGHNEMLKQIFEEYSSYCIYGLLSRHRCSREDAEDIYVDSILNLRDKVVSGKIAVVADLKNYLYGTCQNMFLSRVNQAQRVKAAATELSWYSDSDANILNDDDRDFQERMLKLTEEGLSSLGDKCRGILISFYFTRLSLEEIAGRFNMANANVAKVSKSRCFQQLMNNIRSVQEQNHRSNALSQR